MVAHIRSQHEKSRHFICDLCGKDFKYPQELKAHTRHVHEKVRSDPCKFCNKTFFSNTELKYHVSKCDVRKHNSNLNLLLFYRLELFMRKQSSMIANFAARVSMIARISEDT